MEKETLHYKDMVSIIGPHDCKPVLPGEARKCPPLIEIETVA